MNVKIIASNSLGNAAVVDEVILIDCGVPFNKIDKGCDIQALKYILITHEHGDHYNKTTIDNLRSHNPRIQVIELWKYPRNRVALELHDRSYGIYTTDNLQHDVPNCGVRIDKYQDRNLVHSIFWATDTFDISGEYSVQLATNCDQYFIEAHHLESDMADLIMNVNTPQHKMRALKTHMSYEKCIAFFNRVKKEDSTLVGIHIESSRGGQGWQVIEGAKPVELDYSIWFNSLSQEDQQYLIENVIQEHFDYVDGCAEDYDKRTVNICRRLWASLRTFENKG